MSRRPTSIKTIVGEQARLWHRSFGGGLLEYFVLRNGRARQGRPYTGVRGEPKDCFANAYRLALPYDDKPVGTYVEGFAIRPSLGILVHHAWVERSNRVIDPTWDSPESCFYMGVPFSAKVLSAETLKSGYYGLLCPGEMFNFDLMLSRDPALAGLYPQIARRKAA